MWEETNIAIVFLMGTLRERVKKSQNLKVSEKNGEDETKNAIF